MKKNNSPKYTSGFWAKLLCGILAILMIISIAIYAIYAIAGIL